MFSISRRLHLIIFVLLCSDSFKSPPPIVFGRVIFIQTNESGTNDDNGMMAKNILENSFNASGDDEWSIVNCTIIENNGTNSTNVTCLNYTMLDNGTRIGQRDKFKAFQLLAALIPILIKAAIVLIKIIKVVLIIAKYIVKIGWTILRYATKFAIKAAQFAMKNGKLIGKYMLKAGRLVLESYEMGRGLVDPIMEYQNAQAEARRMAAEEAEWRRQEMEQNRQNWAEDGSMVPDDVGEVPEWQPQRTSSLLHHAQDDELEGMPGALVSAIVIVLVAIIVAMPTSAYIITNQRKRRRRRRRRNPNTKKTKRSKKTVKSKKK